MNILLFFVSLYALIGCLQDAFPTKTGFYLKLTLSVLAFVVSIPGLYFSIKSWYDSPFNRFNLLVYNTLSPIFGDQWANFCRKWGINLFCDVVTKSPVKISGVKFLYWRKRGEFTAPKLNDSDPGTHKMYFHKNKFVRCSLVEKPEWDFPGGYKVYTRPEGQYVFVESDLTFAYFRPGVFESLGERRFVIEEMEKNSVFIHRHQSLVDFLMTYNIITEFYNNNYYLYSSLRKDRNNQHNIIHSENLFELIINKVNMEDLVLVVDNQEFYVEGLNYDFDHDNFLNLFEQEGNRKGVGYLLPMVGNMGNVLALLIHNYLFNRFNLRIDQILINLTNKFPIKDPGCPNAKSKLYRAQLAVIYHRMTKLKICTDKTYSCRVESGMEEKLIEYAKENYRLSKALTAGLEAVKKTELERLKNLEEIRDLARSKQAFTDTKQGVQDKEEKSEKVPGGSRQKTHGGIKGIDIEKEIKEVKDNIKDMKKCIDTKAQLRDAFYRDERKFEVTKTDGGKIWVGNNDKIRVVQYPKTRTEKYNIDLNSDEYTNIRKLNDKPKNLEKRTQYEKLVMSTNDEIERMVLPKEECYIIDQGGVGCKVKLEMNSRYSSKIQGIHLYESAYKEDIGAVEKYILESEKKLEKLEQEWIKVKSKKDKKKKEEEC